MKRLVTPELAWLWRRKGRARQVPGDHGESTDARSNHVMQQRTSVMPARDLEQVVALLLHLVFGIRVEKNQNHCHEPRNRSKH